MKFKPVKELTIEEWYLGQISILAMKYIVKNELIGKSYLSLALNYANEEIIKGYSEFKKTKFYKKLFKEKGVKK